MPSFHDDDPLFAAIGNPRDEVTHWGISRLDKGKPERLHCQNDVGLSQKEWGIEELTYETIKARWASGEYKLHFFVSDPDNEDPHKRYRSCGHSRLFKVAPEASSAIRPPLSAGLPTAPAGADMGNTLDFAMRLIEMVERRTATQLEAATRLASAQTAAPPPSGEVAELRAAVERLRAEAEARQQREETERRHRAELQRLERERDEARRELEEEDDEPAIVAPEGSGFVGQLGAGIASAIVEAAKKNPELVMGVLGNVIGPILAKVQGVQEPQPQPQPKQIEAPQPQPQPQPQPTAPSSGFLSNAMPSVPMDPPPAVVPAVAAVAETTKGGVPITRAGKANGAPKATPAVIDTTAEEIRS